MKRFGIFKRTLAVIGFLGLLTAGFLAVNVQTSCKAEAYLCLCTGAPCTLDAGQTLLRIVTGIVLPDLALATGELVVDFELLKAEPVRLLFQAKIAGMKKIFETFFDSLWFNNMRPAYQGQTREWQVRDEAEAQVIKQFFDAAEVNRDFLDRRLRQVEDHREARPSENACVGATSVGGMTRVNSFRNAYSRAAPAEKAPRGALSTAAGGAAAGAGVDQKNRWNEYVSRYCNKDDNAGAAGCTVSAPYVGRDVDVTGEIFMKDTIDIKSDPETKRVVDDLIENIAEPFVRKQIPGDTLESPEGQAFYLDAEAYRAKRQAIYDALYYVVSRRLPGSVDAAGGGASFISEIRNIAKVNVSNISANPSHNEIMQVMMNDRFKTGTYALDQIDEPENNSRELVIQQAFQTMQLADHLDLLDRYSVILAAQTGDNIKQTKPMSSKIEERNLR